MRKALATLFVVAVIARVHWQIKSVFARRAQVALPQVIITRISFMPYFAFSAVGAVKVWE